MKKSDTLMGSEMKKVVVDTDFWNAAMDEYGYPGISSWLTWSPWKKANLNFFFATSMEDKAITYAAGTIGPDGEISSSALWVNRTANFLDKVFPHEFWSFLTIIIAVALIVIGILSVTFVVRWLISTVRATQATDAELGLERTIYNDSHNTNFSYDDSFHYEDRRDFSDRKQLDTGNHYSKIFHDDPHYIYGGSKEDYSYHDANVTNTGATTVTNSGSHDDHSERRTDIRNTGATTVTNSGSHDDHSSRRTGIRNTGATTVTNSGSHTDRSEKTFNKNFFRGMPNDQFFDENGEPLIRHETPRKPVKRSSDFYGDYYEEFDEFDG